MRAAGLRSTSKPEGRLTGQEYKAQGRAQGQGNQTGFAAGSSGFVGQASHDRQRMHALCSKWAQRIIHKTVSSHAAQAGEARTADVHREVPAFAGTGMAGMQMAVVVHLQLAGRQCLAQSVFDLGGVHRWAFKPGPP